MHSLAFRLKQDDAAAHGWQWLSFFLPLLCLFLSAGFAYAGLAPHYYFDPVAVEQGLPNQSITAMAQDNHGFIWIGSQTGLSRFDGYKLIQYQHNPAEPRSLGDSWVQTVLNDEKTGLWIGSRIGLQRYSPASDDFEWFDLPANGTANLNGNSLKQRLNHVNVCVVI